METVKKILHNGITPFEYSRISHMIYPDDFNMNHPNPNRIDRIAREVDEYLKYKRKNTDI